MNNPKLTALSKLMCQVEGNQIIYGEEAKMLKS